MRALSVSFHFLALMHGNTKSQDFLPSHSYSPNSKQIPSVLCRPPLRRSPRTCKKENILVTNCNGLTSREFDCTDHQSTSLESLYGTSLFNYYLL